MTVLIRNQFPRSANNRGAALIITLSILLILTIIAVTYSAMTRLEIFSARSAYENERARNIGAIAIDDVVAKLRDNIPGNKPWACSPGMLCVYTNATWKIIPLYSGTSSANGTVALNAALPGANTKYPIIPKNSEYPSPDAMRVAWINVLQDGTRSTDSDYAPSATNPIVGRYAYWVDTETSKVNLNTAGKAQTTYNFNAGTGDMQNLSGHPSRVDLSRLDNSAGTISAAESLNTYLYTASTYWYGSGANHDQLGAITAAPGVRAAGQGLKRFNSIEEWGNISGITAEIVEANKFYLTTKAWTPELNPWGLNKLWWQNNAPQTGISNNPYSMSFQSGNRVNASGSPGYTPPASATTTKSYPDYRGVNADFRYYVYPAYLGAQSASAIGTDLLGYAPSGNNSECLNMQRMGASGTMHEGANGNVATINTFIHNMIFQLSRKDWPGMPASSFVDKYGQEECEDLALNMLMLFDSAVNFGGNSPANIYPYPYRGPANTSLTPAMVAHDFFGVYGGSSYIYTATASKPPTPTALTPGGRLMSGIGPWPYMNEIAVGFTPTTSGKTRDISSNPIPGYSGDTTATSLVPAASGLKLITKDSTGPGFAPALNASFDALFGGGISYKNCVNVQITPYMEITYPQNLAQGTKYVTGLNGAQICYAGVSDIEVVATGTFNGKSVKYSGANFIWGYPDDNPSAGYGYGLMSAFLYGSAIQPSSTPKAVGPLGSFYIGPFDQGTSANVTVKFRAYISFRNSWSASPLELAPLGWSYPLSAASQVNDTSNTKFDFSANIDLNGSTTYSSLEVTDPRVYRYRADWRRSTASSGWTMGAVNSGYVSSYTDPSTGINGDDSKLAWPNVEAMGYVRNARVTNGTIDPRWYQNAGNIVGFPGIGWLSVLPTNCESGGGAWDSTFTLRTNSNSTPAVIPWRTISLEPATKPNQLPDWLLLEAFALAYEHTFLSQSQGKININASISPFGLSRLGPLKSLLIPSKDSVGTVAKTIAQDLANHTGATSGPCANLSSDLYIYPGQICQVPGMGGTGGDQYQREALMRDIAGLVTTQSSDFKVHVVAQAVKEIAFTGNMTNDLLVTAEQRFETMVSRVVDIGPDGVPGTGDDMAGQDRIVGTADDLTFKAQDGGVITRLSYDHTDKPLESFAGRPPFRYVISDTKSISP